MQEPGRRPFAGVDLRRPKGYPMAPVAEAQEEAGDPCPRCQSRDTKFCYYNNYNTSQPRHYCRSCRRYWTKGGSLRNVPVGGASRKSTSSSSSASAKRAKNSMGRRVGPAPPLEPEPEPSATDAAGAAQTLDTANGVVGHAIPDVDAARATTNDPATAVNAARTEATVDDPATAVGVARTEATAGGATDDPGAIPAVEDGVFPADLSVALGLGMAGADGKEPSEASLFEWPSGCELGSYWAPPGVFADIDPVLFLNLP